MINDRFKFRVYFKGSEYAEAGYQDLTRNDVIFSLRADGQIIRTVVYGCQQKEHEKQPCYMPFTPDNDLYDVQFCTGLKDKNGKLIYEGDIVNVKIDGLNKSYIPKVVVWDRKEWQLKKYNKNFKQNCSACEVKTRKKCQYCSQYFQATGHTNFKDFYNNEVVGNIYENKDLLND